MDSFIGWIGGKKLLRERIVSLFPKEKITKYVEVFGGAGWVLFHKEKIAGQTEVFNDINSDLINLYRCIKYHGEAVVKELEGFPSSREIFRDYKENFQNERLTDIQSASMYFYLVKASFGNNVRSFRTKLCPINKTLERFYEIQKRLGSVIIENKDFKDIIKVYDRDSTLFYLDPPYHKTEFYYGKNNKTFTEDSHYKLRDCLKDIKGKFILTYNDDDFIRNLYKEFNIETAVRKNTLAAFDKSPKELKELIITNY